MQSSLLVTNRILFAAFQRSLATAILALINMVGVGIGFLFSSFFVDESYSANSKG